MGTQGLFSLGSCWQGLSPAVMPEVGPLGRLWVRRWPAECPGEREGLGVGAAEIVGEAERPTGREPEIETERPRE